MVICELCGDEVDLFFWEESGGLCGYCLANAGFMAEIPGDES